MENGKISCLVNLSEGGRNIIAYGSYDKTIKILNLDDNYYCNTFYGHTRNPSFLIKIEIQNLLSTNNKTFLLSGGWDNEIKLWDIEDEKCVQTFKGKKSHKGAITCLTNLTKNDKIMFVSGSHDCKLKFWKSGTEECFLTIDAHSDFVLSMDSNEEKDLIISSSSDKTIKIWDVTYKDESISSIKKRHTLIGHEGSVNSVAYLQIKNKNMAVSGGLDKIVKVWDIDGGWCLMSLIGHSSTIGCIQSLGTDSSGVCKIASAGFDKTIIIWNANTGEKLYVLKGHEHIIEYLSI